MSLPSDTFTDEELTAFLDGEADDLLNDKISNALQSDPVLRQRCENLDAPISAVKASFDLKALNAPSLPSSIAEPQSTFLRRATFPAALAASFALGLFVSPMSTPAPDWIAQVASYQALYVSETLDGPQQDVALTQAVFAQAQAAINTNLTSAPQIEGMTFKRAQILSVNGEVLLQIAYLGADGTPYALCLTQVKDSDQPAQFGMSHNLSMSSWVKDGLGYVLIGGTDADQINDAAKGLSRSL